MGLSSSNILTLPVQALGLFCAVILYGLFGSPTPDHPGWPELVIGVLLLVSTGMGSINRLRAFRRGENAFLLSLHILFFVGLIVPTVTGALRGNDTNLMLRDVLAFLFLCLPLFILHPFERDERAEKLLPWVLVFAGLMFAIRTLLPAFNIWIADGELLYLSNSPLVLFAALYLTAMLWGLYTNLTLRKFLISLIPLAVIAVILAAMLLDVQRATVAAIAVTLAAFWLTTLTKTPRRVIIPTILAIALGSAIYPWLTDTAGAIYKKTSEVGLNSRVQELQAVIHTVTADPVLFFFGTGWGGAFADPAVGLLDVNYTHSLLTTMFLKGGVVLLTLAVFVCLTGLKQIVLIFQQDSRRALTVFWPFIIPIFLYASHKSLDFGLLLLLIGVWSNRPERLRPPA